MKRIWLRPHAASPDAAADLLPERIPEPARHRPADPLPAGIAAKAAAQPDAAGETLALHHGLAHDVNRDPARHASRHDAFALLDTTPQDHAVSGATCAVGAHAPHLAGPHADPATGSRRVILPQFHQGISDAEMDAIVDKATIASNFLKAVSHEGRLLILCHLVSGEKSVTELEDLLSARQAAVSQQLSRLRLEGLVVPRRDGKAIYYRLADDRPARVLELVYELFCDDSAR